MTRPHARRAFALVDAVVGAVLLGVSLAVVIGLAGRAISSQTRGQQLATAAMLADEQLKLVLARGPDDYARRFPTQGTCEEPFTDYRYTVALTGGSASEPYRVSATILWTLGAIEQSLTIETLMAARDPGETGAEVDPIRAPAAPVLRTQ